MTLQRETVLRILEGHRTDIHRFGVNLLRLFGSVARNEAGEKSDVDLLVDYATPPSFSDFMDLRFYLEDLLQARVDLVTEKGLRERVRPFVEEDAIRVSCEPRLFLEDIERSCAKVIRYSEGLHRDEVFGDEMRFDGILHNLQVIGEAVKNLPDDLRARYPDIPWRKVAGMRDIVAHAYFSLDLEILWSAIRSDVPELLRQIRRVLAEVVGQ